MLVLAIDPHLHICIPLLCRSNEPLPFYAGAETLGHCGIELSESAGLMLVT